MLIIPAIDLKDGKVVRFTQGRFDKKVYSDNPAETAKKWIKQGAQLIHVVDLDGAICGEPKNLGALKEIVKVEGARIEFGGGVRTKEALKQILDIGVYRVVLGTLAFEDRRLLEDMLNNYKEKIIVSIDRQSDGTVALKGWRESAGRQSSLFSFAKNIYKNLGVNRIIYTDVLRDGTLEGPRESLLEDFLNLLHRYQIKMSVIVAGGISSLVDIEYLKRLENKGLEGIIIGKALYEGKFDLTQAINIAK